MKRIFPTVMTLVLAGAVSLTAQEATAREEKQAIKTYPFSGPDPSPIMVRSGRGGRGASLYPYFPFDGFSTTGVEQTWNVVHLENPYIRVFILPGEGGKLMGAIEKSTGKDFIYDNHVRKFRDIALRGPWTSGGIELNFGIVGHSPSTATPVDYVVHKNANGSVSCTVGAMDLSSRTEWRVTYTLPRDKAYIELKSLWYNPQPLNQSYYVWMNAANKLTKDLEFILPGTQHIGHNYAAPEQPWPIAPDGRNLAFYKEQKDSDDGSFFIFGKLQDFSGGYWHDSAFGYGHYARHEEVPGQKFFRWPLSRAGAIWENLLTDTDGPYFEHQNGRLLDQNDHEFFAPYTTDRWNEIYFPYKNIGPMVQATPYGALNVRNTGKQIVLGFCPLQRIDEQLVVRAAGKQVYSDRLVLQPMEVYRKTLPVSVGKGELQVEIGNKLSYTDDPAAGLLKRPLNFLNYDENTVEGLYQSAQRDEKSRNYAAALQKYLECLKREPLEMRALTRVAELYCRRAEYNKALEFARKALDYVMYDPDANYIYGIIATRLDDLTDAKETLGWAARSMKYRFSAYSELGSIYLMEGNLDRAVEYLRRSLKYDADNIRTRQVLATAYRLRKEPEKAREILRQILAIDPLSHFAQFEQYLLDQGPQTRHNFQSTIRNEFPHEPYLEIAACYVDLRLNDDALRVLELAPEQATVRYWQAYLLRKKSPEHSRKALESAAALSPYLVFPFREESIPVFQWAAAARPNDWKAKYYLGLIYWGMGRREDALKMFDECGDRPDYAPAYTSRAFLEQDANPEKAQADYERALAAGKNDWRNWYRLAMFYSEKGTQEKALKLAVAASAAFPNEDRIKILLARTELNNGRYQGCNSVLGNATILPYEGQRDVHELFVNCQLCQAMREIKKGAYGPAIKLLEASREYPERLGTGKPSHPDYRLQDYLELLVYEKMGVPADISRAEARIKADSGNLEAIKQKVDQWYGTTFRAQSELRALQELGKIVRGGPRRHVD